MTSERLKLLDAVSVEGWQLLRRLRSDQSLFANHKEYWARLTEPGIQLYERIFVHLFGLEVNQVSCK